MKDPVNNDGYYMGDGFVAFPNDLLSSLAVKSLSPSAFKAWVVFMRNSGKNGDPMLVSVSFKMVKDMEVCSSPTTFDKVKRELVAFGLLDQVSPGGLREMSVFKFSDRWKL